MTENMDNAGAAHFSGRARVDADGPDKIIRVRFPAEFRGYNYALEIQKEADGASHSGPYVIDFVLCSDHMLNEHDLSHVKPERGYSYLQAAPSLQKVTAIKVEYMYPNVTGEKKTATLAFGVDGPAICKFTVTSAEQDLHDALLVAGQIVHGTLDAISLRRRVPVQIRHIEVRSHSPESGFVRRYLTAPYCPVSIDEDDLRAALSVPPSLRPAIRLFREAISSSRPHYRLLCLYRVREALIKVKGANDHALLERGVTPERPTRRVPDNAVTQQFFAAYIGQRLNALLDFVRTEYRVPVAHFTVDEYERMVLDPTDVRLNHRVDATSAVLIEMMDLLIQDEINLMLAHRLP